MLEAARAFDGAIGSSAGSSHAGGERPASLSTVRSFPLR